MNYKRLKITLIFLDRVSSVSNSKNLKNLRGMRRGQARCIFMNCLLMTDELVGWVAGLLLFIQQPLIYFYIFIIFVQPINLKLDIYHSSM